MTEPEKFTLPGEAGREIPVQLFVPELPPIGVIQIAHGLGEYIDRYARFAAAANARGFVVIGHDHRGHGDHGEERGYFAPKDGWLLVSDDMLKVHEAAVDRYPELPITLLGHSMGSFFAQYFAMVHGARLSALILSASTWPSRPLSIAGNLMARLVCFIRDERSESPFLDKLGFGSHNKRFEPARTEHDWLSRDEAEVDKYENDPLCGGPFTAGLWRDLTSLLMRLGSEDAINRVPTDLPVLITGGSVDPVGGEDGMGKLALHLAQTSHTRIKVKIYPEGRHEMLNETNRDEVTADWLDWLTTATRAS